MTEAEQNDESTAFESVEPYEAPEVERLTHLAIRLSREQFESLFIELCNG